MLQLKLATYPLVLFYCISLWRIVCVTSKKYTILTEQGTGTRAVLAFLQCSAAIEDILFVGLKSSFILFYSLRCFFNYRTTELIYTRFSFLYHASVCTVWKGHARTSKFTKGQASSRKVKQGKARPCDVL